MARAGELEVALETRPEGTTVVHVDGELDMATTPELEEVVEGLDLGGKVVIDLTGCGFLDSSAVRVLVETARAADEAGGTISVVASDRGIRRVLEIAAVDRMLPVHERLDSAL